MKLVDMKVTDYLDLLKSDVPAPGGGSVSALAGAQGVGLFMMVCDLTTGKEKYAAFEAACREAKEKGAKLFTALHDGIDKDTDAYNLIAAAFKMPKDTDEAKAARSKAIAEATLTATQIPFDNLTYCYEGLKIASGLTDKTNPNCASDLGVAILNLWAGMLGTWMNVKINLPGVKDEAKKAAFLAEGEKMMADGKKIAEAKYEEILANL